MILAVLTAALPAAAQGTIEGYVYEAETDTPLAGVSVALDGTSRGAATDPDGFYRITDVAPGTYRVVATLLGYVEGAASVDVAGGGAVRQDFTLRSTSLELNGVTVTGLRQQQVRAVVEKREALSVVDVIGADEIGQLPDLNVAESAQRLPGVTIRTDRGEATSSRSAGRHRTGTTSRSTVRPWPRPPARGQRRSTSSRPRWSGRSRSLRPSSRTRTPTRSAVPST